MAAGARRRCSSRPTTSAFSTLVPSQTFGSTVWILVETTSAMRSGRLVRI